MHTILGANGVIARELSKALPQGTAIRQVSRNPRQVNPTDQTFSADLLDKSAVERAVAGSDVAYLVAGLEYSIKVWEEQWPRLMQNVIEACKRHQTKLVFFDNVYAYGRVQDKMTEETPFNPVSRKGEVRARIATTLLNEIKQGELTAMIVRAADFYGPGATTSMMQVTVFDRLAHDKTPQWIGNPKTTHTFTYTPDAGRVVAKLAQTEAAWGQTWHAPTSAELITGEQFVQMACAAAGKPYRIQVAPKLMLRIMGLFMPVIRENHEMMYQFDYDYQFDSSKIRNALGIEATSYQEGIPKTTASSQESARSASVG
jgi:nucleoside-diphosphate-sugar epimerase